MLITVIFFKQLDFNFFFAIGFCGLKRFFILFKLISFERAKHLK